MKRYREAQARGQVLPIVLAVLLILTIFIPLMVFYTQRDAIWTVKQARNTRAFHLAEAGVEKSYLYISQSTTTWQALMNGTAQTGYNFDKSYSDVDGGTYSVSITSGPAAQEVTVISVGRDSSSKEVRSLQVIYANSVFGSVAVYGGNGVQISGGITVEWGAVMSPKSINSNGLTYPQFWSASSIIPFDTDPNLPHTDGVQWHAFYPNIPPPPALDFDYYRNAAKNNTTGGCPAAVGSINCWYPSSADLSSWSAYPTSGVIFAEGDITGKKMYHVGTMIVMGTFHLKNGTFGKGSPTMTLPSTAWKQYGSPASASAAWTHYKTFDTSAGVPASFPGLNSTYVPSPTQTVADSKCAVNGMLYINGDMTDAGGGGNADIYGAMTVIGQVSIGAMSGVTLYFNSSAASGLVTTSIALSRISWQNASYGWPSSLP